LKLSTLRKNEEDLVKNAWFGVEQNLLKVVVEAANLLPVAISPKKYVQEFLKQLSLKKKSVVMKKVIIVKMKTLME